MVPPSHATAVPSDVFAISQNHHLTIEKLNEEICCSANGHCETKAKAAAAPPLAAEHRSVDRLHAHPVTAKSTHHFSHRNRSRKAVWLDKRAKFSHSFSGAAVSASRLPQTPQLRGPLARPWLLMAKFGVVSTPVADKPLSVAPNDPANIPLAAVSALPAWILAPCRCGLIVRSPTDENHPSGGVRGASSLLLPAKSTSPPLSFFLTEKDSRPSGEEDLEKSHPGNQANPPPFWGSQTERVFKKGNAGHTAFAGRRSDRAPSSHGVQSSNAAASERTCQTAEVSAIRSQAGGGASWFPQLRRGETSFQAETSLTVLIPRYDGPGILVFGPVEGC
ncbi:hypothetical protein CMUS01_12209 [Colletotrichum musicola]|uniref:Uncharacterized protein n=1 Tax=Colletotrichum musicola TaxID=2175873 RepID=A0A8H6JP03_9PEZI|nr:hypothetical protein CMUS01_12209 [Colletotrichum musicola]